VVTDVKTIIAYMNVVYVNVAIRSKITKEQMFQERNNGRLKVL
jgi:hypothetical protein